MLISSLTSKGQATIPAEIREMLHLTAGDKVAFEIKDQKIIISKVEPFDLLHHQALSNTLSEWDSAADHEAYDDL